MATGWILREMNPAHLKSHPVNLEIYGDQGLIDDDMLASVKEHGIIDPLKATKDDVVISGERRRVHALKAKCKTVPVLVCRHVLSSDEQVIEIVESNRQRVKTMEQKARAYSKLAEAKAEIARKRLRTSTGGAKPQPTKIFSEAEKGEAKSQAAAEVGMSRPTAEKAAEVVAEIDRREASGDKKGAEDLRSKLNDGPVAAAHREVKPKSASAVNRNGKKTVAPPPYDRNAIDKQFGSLVRAIDEMARVCALNNSPKHRDATTKLSAAFDAFKALAKECDAVQARKAK